MRPNWFVAFPVSGGFVESLPALPKNFRRFEPDDVHLTISFLGACGEERARAAWAALQTCVQELAVTALPITLAEVVPMGSARAYTALSALVGQGREDAMARLAALRDTLADAANVKRDKRPPKPHVTLARPNRRASDEDRQAGLSWAASVDVRTVACVLDRVALYTWSDVRRERLFRIVAELLLRDR
jgi:2'-5' RNA ligase